MLIPAFAAIPTLNTPLLSSPSLHRIIQRRQFSSCETTKASKGQSIRERAETQRAIIGTHSSGLPLQLLPLEARITPGTGLLHPAWPSPGHGGHFRRGERELSLCLSASQMNKPTLPPPPVTKGGAEPMLKC